MADLVMKVFDVATLGAGGLLLKGAEAVKAGVSNVREFRAEEKQLKEDREKLLGSGDKG